MERDRRIVHMTSVHLPFDTRIFYKECKALATAGFEVKLVAPHDESGILDSVAVCAVPRPKNRYARFTRTVRQVYRSALASNASVCHFHDPELILVGLLLKLQGRRVVYDVHEDLPKQILSKHWVPRPLRRLVAMGARAAEAVAARAFDGIVAATPAIARRFPPHKTVVVQNFPILNELVVPDSIPYQERPAKVVYMGGISEIRGVREMVRAMSLLPGGLDARLILAGSFSPPSLENEMRSLPGWERVEFVGWQDRASVARLLGQARAGLVLFHPEPNHLESQPNKLFEYMSAGLPVIASDFPLWRQIVEGEGCGLLVDPQSPEAIAEAVHWILEHPEEAEAMGRQGQKAVFERYNWEAEAEKLIALYRLRDPHFQILQ